MSRQHLTLAAPQSEPPCELIHGFAHESLEALDHVEALVNALRVSLDAGPEVASAPGLNSQVILPEVLRALHTLRSNAATLHLHAVHQVAQACEGAVDQVSRLGMPPSHELLALLSEALVGLKLFCLRLLSQTPETTASGPEDSNDLRNLQALEQRLLRASQSLRRGEDVPAPLIGELLVSEGNLRREDLDRVLELQQQPTGALLVALGLTTPAQLESALARQPVGHARPQLRLDARRLEAFQELTTGLLMSCARLQQTSGHPPDPALLEVRRLSRSVWTELQQLRQAPIGPLLERLASVAQDIAQRQGRPIEVQIEGGNLEYEAEYAVVLNSILPHAIRNALDHGIEPPATRRRNGKSAHGRLLLKAFRAGKRLHLVVADDGAGFDLEALSQRAQQLHVPDSAQKPAPDCFEMLFAHGFTTKNSAGPLSGRGVGLGAMREAVVRLGGQLWIANGEHAGAELHITLPTAAGTLDGMAFISNGLHYLVPAESVVEFSRPTKNQCRSLRGPTLYLPLRGEMLPLVWIETALGRAPSRTPLWESLVVVVNVKERNFGLVVHELLGPQRIPAVLSQMASQDGVAGRVVLDQGDVAEVLELEQLFYHLSDSLLDSSAL